MNGSASGLRLARNAFSLNGASRGVAGVSVMDDEGLPVPSGAYRFDVVPSGV